MGREVCADVEFPKKYVGYQPERIKPAAADCRAD